MGREVLAQMGDIFMFSVVKNYDDTEKRVTGPQLQSLEEGGACDGGCKENVSALHC